MRIFIVGFLVSFLCLPTLKAERVYVDNVIIVLDASGSMKETMKGGGRHINRLQAAKKAIKEVMKTIPQSTQVGLLVFGGRHNGWVYPLGVRDDVQLFKAVDKVNAAGGTPLGEYMKKAADQLLKARKKQYGYGSYRLLIVTDGEASDSRLVEKYTPDIVARGIVTDVIGVDMKKAHTLATKVHSYRSANDPAALKKAIQEVFAEVGKTSDGQSGENTFEELEGFPADLSMAVISAWGSSGNHKIGEVPSKLSTAPTKQAPKPSIAPSGNSKPTASKSSNSGILKFLAVAGIIFFVIVVSAIKRKVSS